MKFTEKKLEKAFRVVAAGRISPPIRHYD